MWRCVLYRHYRPLDVVQREVPVLTLDCDIEFEDNEERQKKLLKLVNDFIDSIEIRI